MAMSMSGATHPPLIFFRNLLAKELLAGRLVRASAVPLALGSGTSTRAGCKFASLPEDSIARVRRRLLALERRLLLGRSASDIVARHVAKQTRDLDPAIQLKCD
jgi:hypothetical protein